MSKAYHIVLAAGGTGGHIFPAEALAEELVAAGHKVSLVTDSRFCDYAAGSMKGVLGQIPIHYVQAGTLGAGILGKVKGLSKMAYGVFQARRLLARLKPHVVVGFGGYPSFPTMIAASYGGYPTVIHEQNAVLGRANRVLASKVNRIATSFADTRMIQDENRSKEVLVGNPVRAAVKALHSVPYSELEQDGVMRLLVTGGSQGAKVFSTIVPGAIALLPEGLQQRIRVDQQVRAEDMDKTRAAYKNIGIAADLAPFFTDIPARLASAHLVIARSGASTMAEVTCAGRPAILVPYPNSADDHQKVNASALDDCGGGWMMTQDSFTVEALAAKIEAFLLLPASLTRSAENAKSSGRVNAAHDLMKIVLAEVPNATGETEQKSHTEERRAV
jgi:UDP-N-acetylglucosamine--N-acetylmuramyl-(pentapeptide) pyrophosphoryl-undecaprenol N-acetylglucosamine transferase